MRLPLKIILLWLLILAVYVGCLQLFPHSPAPASAHLNRIIQSLLLVITVFIFLKEPNRKNKFIFLNFLIYFSLCILALVYDFVGKAFYIDKYAKHIFLQYLTMGYVLFMAISIIYVVIDLLFREFKVFQKYICTFIIALGIFIWLFHPFVQNSLYLYSTEEIKQFKALDSAIPPGSEIPSAVQLANKVTLQSWKDGKAIGDLYPEDNLRRIEYLLPYLEGENYKVLMLRPFYFCIIGMDVLILAFVILYFGYQYKKDPPQGAYIDKIMFLFLLISSIDILHLWGFNKSVEWGSFSELFIIGQYITVLTELMMVLFFSLRLSFITSVQGEFYETELATNPRQVSRLRDWVDNMVLSHFFNFKLFNGRLFQNPSEK